MRPDSDSKIPPPHSRRSAEGRRTKVYKRPRFPVGSSEGEKGGKCTGFSHTLSPSSTVVIPLRITFISSHRRLIHRRSSLNCTPPYYKPTAARKRTRIAWHTHPSLPSLIAVRSLFDNLLSAPVLDYGPVAMTWKVSHFLIQQAANSGPSLDQFSP